MTEFNPVSPRNESLALRVAFASLRSYLRKLYACSTTDEVLELVQETAVAHFPETPYLTTASRLPDGGWSFEGEGIGSGSRLRAYRSHSEEVVGPIFASKLVAADDLMCFPQAASPGDLLTFEHYDEPKLAGILGKDYPEFKRLHEPMLAAVIRSRADFVAHLYLADFLKIYDTEVDREMVRAIVDFASLAGA